MWSRLGNWALVRVVQADRVPDKRAGDPGDLLSAVVDVWAMKVGADAF